MFKRLYIILALFYTVIIQGYLTYPEITYTAPAPSLSDSLLFLPLNKTNLLKVMEYYELEHKEVVLAQALLETGNFKSRVCKVKNNLFGLYNSRKRRYFSFKHWTLSVSFYKNNIQSRLKPNENYYSFLKRIHYAEDKKYIYKLQNIVNKQSKRPSKK